MKTTAIITSLAVALTGCANASKNVIASYVSPIQYQSYDCDQMGAEAHRLTAKLQQLGGRLDEAATNDQTIMAVTLVLFWPAAFALGGTKAQEAEYARLKGEADAIHQAAIARKCPGVMLNPAPAVAQTPSPAMSLVVDQRTAGPAAPTAGARGTSVVVPTASGNRGCIPLMDGSGICK